MTALAFIEKYGTTGLLEAIGNKTSGHIVRGNDYACVVEILKLLEGMR